MKRVLLLVCVMAVAMSCDALSRIGEPGQGLYPDACGAWGFPERQCKAIVDNALDQSGLTKDEVVRIWLLPFEGEATLGGHQVARVGFELPDGNVIETDVHCGGIHPGPACDPNAEIWVVDGVDRDVPCTGEAPQGCATIPPTPPAEAMANAVALEVARLSIPIDRAGVYEIKVGAARLANGYLVERSMSLVDPRPGDYWIRGGIRLDIRPDDPERPEIGSLYREPFDGPEPVTVFVVFEVTDLATASTLEIRDIVVR